MYLLQLEKQTDVKLSIPSEQARSDKKVKVTKKKTIKRGKRPDDLSTTEDEANDLNAPVHEEVYT